LAISFITLVIKTGDKNRLDHFYRKDFTSAYMSESADLHVLTLVEGQLTRYWVDITDYRLGDAIFRACKDY
jgi:hypothetical protein